jgi:hypothetical protein
MGKPLSTSILARYTVLCLAASWIVIVGCVSAVAECPGDTPGVIRANPNRPTISDPADITQFGVAEVEYGWADTWQQAGVHRTTIEGLLKLAVLCDLELRWTQDTFVSQAVPGQQRVHGFGDQLVGFQYRLHHQSQYLPTIAFRYEAKIPTASSRLGIGSGELDHNLTFLASKDFGGYHFDFNETAILSGRSGASGFDKNSFTGLAGSHPLHGPLAITGEIYAFTRQNASTAGFSSTLWGLTYNINPRLVLDSAIDVGLSPAAPHKSVVAGFTYSLGDVRAALKSLHQRL